MKSVYHKPQLTIHGSIEKITLNTGRTTEQDFVILTGLPGGDVQSVGQGGSLNFQTQVGGGGGFVPK